MKAAALKMPLSSHQLHSILMRVFCSFGKKISTPAVFNWRSQHLMSIHLRIYNKKTRRRWVCLHECVFNVGMRICFIGSACLHIYRQGLMFSEEADGEWTHRQQMSDHIHHVARIMNSQYQLSCENGSHTPVFWVKVLSRLTLCLLYVIWCCFL